MTLEALENEIRELLLAFEAERGQRISHVTVDTRNFAECRVEVFLK